MGEGECSGPILENYQDITFADISKNSLMLLKTIVLFKKSITFKECNMEIFHLIMKYLILSHVQGLSYGDNKLVLNEIHRVLKQNGIFICIDSLNENPIYVKCLHYLRK